MMKRDDQNNIIVEQLVFAKVNIIKYKDRVSRYETNIGQYPKQSMYIKKIEPKCPHL